MTAERESMTLQEMGAPALGVEERRDEAPRAGASHARPTPDPEVVAKPKRRKFTAQYRLRILEEAESCTQPGEVGRLLRREGLYSSHLTEWRRARREGSLQGLPPSRTQAFNFTPVNDSVDEGLSETVVFTGTAPELAVGTATLTITDDDGKGNFAHRKTAMGNYRPALRSFHPVLTVLDQDHLDLPLHRMGRPHMTTPVPLSSD